MDTVTTLALPFQPAAAMAIGRSAMHKLVLALVWLTVASGAVVFSEPALVDVLTMGLIVLLPVIGLVAISAVLIWLGNWRSASTPGPEAQRQEEPRPPVPAEPPRWERR